MSDLRAPFPWFGGKSRVASLVWERFGNVPNYVEPFFGSGAVLLGRPHPPGTETVNDLDCYIANFWRSLQANPITVARWADWPVNEADLLARHKRLLAMEGFRQRMRSEPDYYDAKVAGWWVWGICAWIGSGWCRVDAEQLPHLGTAGQGINRKLPHLGDAGRGINRKLPHLGDAGRDRWTGDQPEAPPPRVAVEFAALADRLRDVRVACGEWDRVLGPSVTWRHGVTGVFLDPPYGASEHSVTYSASVEDVAGPVRAWAAENGDNPMLRIALCGYAGEHDDALRAAGWSSVRWKARGGFGSQGDGRGRDNAARETIWFSPHCVGGVQGILNLDGDAA